MSTTNNNNNGDTVMLLEAARPSWSSSSVQIDALPYIDDEYGDPKVKADVDRLIEEEMRRSNKKPSDYLKDLPPVAKFNFEGEETEPHDTSAPDHSDNRNDLKSK